MNIEKPFLIVSLIFFISCNNQPNESTVDTQTTNTDSLHCYRYVNNMDTVILKPIFENGNVKGTLFYNFYEKDKNAGTIQGLMKDDLLIADYTFNSEGSTSVRQIAFKKTGTTFIEGYGESEFKNGKMMFKNIDSLNYDHSIILSEIDCE